MPDLTGMRALVTGGGTGIGFGIAEQLLAGGADVTIVGRRADVLGAAAERLRTGAPGREVRAFPADMCEDDQIQAAVTAAAGDANLDVFVANATSGGFGTMLEIGPEMWEAAVRLNIVGNAMAIKHAGHVMRDHGGGSFVAISSTSATKVQPWLSPYVTTKHALDMMVRCAAVELAPYDIPGQLGEPGYTLSESMVSMTPPELARTLRKATPLGRAGEPARDRSRGRVPRQPRGELDHRAGVRRRWRAEHPGHAEHGADGGRGVRRGVRARAPAAGPDGAERTGCELTFSHAWRAMMQLNQGVEDITVGDLNVPRRLRRARERRARAAAPRLPAVLLGMEPSAARAGGRRLPGRGARPARLLAGGPAEGVEHYDQRSLVGDVLAIADHLGARRFHLVGHDWGAIVAWHVAGWHPDRLNR